jgi:peptidyl-prolyl cis-trans isomerase SurA
MNRHTTLGAVLLAASLIAANPAQAQKLKMPPQTPAAQTPASQSTAQTASPAADAAKPDAAAAPDSLSAAYPVAEILVRINGQIISKQDLERSDQQLTEQAREENWSPEEIARRKKTELSDLIDQQLLLSRGKELDIKADDELIRQLDEIRKQNHLDSMEDLEKAARSQGVSFEDFKANIRNSIITRSVIRDEVGRNIHLTSSDAEAYYNAHKDEYTLPESVHLGEILIPSGTTDDELAAAKARADKIEADLQGGAKFDDLAKSVSTGPTAAQGGDLGVFKRGQLAKELEDKTFSLKDGQITEPIRTRQGYVILKTITHTPEGLQPYKDVEEQVQQQVYTERMQPALRAYLTKLREEAFIDVKPGYVDANASPNESKPVFSAYTPPQKKSHKAKPSKERFRSTTVMAKDRPAPTPRPKDADDTVADAAKNTPVGGPTSVANTAYDKTEQQQAAEAAVASTAKPSDAKRAAAPVNVSAKQPKTRKYKVRYGQGEKAAQLPPSTTEAPAGTAAADQELAAANAQQSDASVQARLTPESQQLLGTAPAAPQKKTRMTQQAVVPHKEAKAEKAQAKAETKKANTPPPPDAAEVATQAVNSAPLGLGGNTAQAKAKAKPVASGEKQRLEDAKAKPGDASATQQPTTVATAAPEKKRHKLLGIL